MTAIKCLLEESGCISQHEPGIIQGEKIVLFSEWNAYASRVAARLKEMGVQPGDRVSLFMANDWRLLVILMGVIRAGAIACPLSTRLPRQAVAERMGRIGSRVLVAYLAENNTEGLGDIRVVPPDDLTVPGSETTQKADAIDLNRPAVILFTSGSSGEPKPVVLSYGNLYYNARGANLNMRIRSKDRWLLNLPMYHVSGIGIVFRALLSGAAVIIPEMKKQLIDALIDFKPSYVSVVPAQLRELAEHEDVSMIPRIDAFLVGGDGVQPELAARCSDLKWPIYLTYGMTEMGSQIATVSDDLSPEKRISTCGRPLRNREVSIDGTGEILVRGHCLFLGYWDGSACRLPLDEEGWFHTGDLGHLDEEGCLVVTGRKDNQFISGGENIQPEEIERALVRIEGIEKAVVVPVDHKKFGKRPVAFVQANVMAPAAWRVELAAALPGFMIPDAFLSFPEDRGNTGMKDNRKALAQAAAAAHRK